MISAIVAVDNSFGIGFNNELLEHIPEDLKNFKDLTTGNFVVMGRKTYDSLPKKPLPNRHNIIITSKEVISQDKNITYMTLENFLRWVRICKYKHSLNIYVIGGASIYEQLLPYCDAIYLTKIYKEHDNVDAYFPNIDKDSDWIGTALSDIKEYNNIPYQFWHYSRR